MSQSQTNTNSTVNNNNNNNNNNNSNNLATSQQYKQPVNGNPVIGQYLAATNVLSTSSSSSSASSSPIKTELNTKKLSTNYTEQMSI